MKDRNGDEVPFVLGVGLPRTGSASLKFALERLLEGPCYHMWEICWPDYIRSRVDHAHFWNASMDGNVDARAKVDFLLSRGYKAACDLPMLIFWKEIFENVPNCRVILTVRDPLSWFRSIQNSLNNPDLQALHNSMARYAMMLTGFYTPLAMGKRATEMIHIGMEHIESYSASEAAAVYKRWLDDVKATVPKDQLLIYHLGSGWEPICDFLNLDVPRDEMTGEEVSYPRINDTKEIGEVLRTYLRYHQKIFYFGMAAFGLTVATGITGYRYLTS